VVFTWCHSGVVTVAAHGVQVHAVVSGANSDGNGNGNDKDNNKDRDNNIDKDKDNNKEICINLV